MAINLLDSVSSILGSQVTRQASAIFGDSEASTAAGLRASSTSVLASLVNAGAKPNGAADLLKTLTNGQVDADLPSRLGNVIGDRRNVDAALAAGGGFVNSIFGSRSGGVADAIASVAGVKSSSALGFLSMVAPLVLSLLKRQVSQNGLNAAGLGSLLTSQRAPLMKAGLDPRITSAMGFPSLQSMLPSVPDDARVKETARPEPIPPAAEYARVDKARSNRRWIPWAIGAAIVAAVLLSTFGTRDRGRTATSLPATVYFDSGQAAVDANDRQTIVAVATAVKTSDVPVRITGYTDSSGTNEQNLELARNRAVAVRDALVAEGVPESRIVMVPPAFVAEGGDASESRKVEISLATAGTETRR